MRILRNQTTYQCEYCNRRKLTKRGAILHEQKYCSNPNSPHQIMAIGEMTKNQGECPHDNVDTVWGYIPGEAVKQPEYDECSDCGRRM